MNAAPIHQKSLRITLIDCGSRKIGALFSILRNRSRHVSRVSLDDARTCAFAQADAVVISGGPHLFTDPESGEGLRRKFQFISRISIPMLGICLGHQAIGLHFGADVFRGEEDRGMVKIKLCRDHKLFEGIPDAPAFAADHCEGITLPRNFITLARSKNYPVEAMASAARPVFGIQFHPEISGAPGRQVIGNFLDMVCSIGG